MKHISINIIAKSVTIKSDDFSFMYDKELSNDPRANELNDIYRYYGGLQCNFDDNSEDYKELEKKLCMFSNSLLKMQIQLNV